MKDPATRVLLERAREWQAAESSASSKDDHTSALPDHDAEDPDDVSTPGIVFMSHAFSALTARLLVLSSAQPMAGVDAIIAAITGGPKIAIFPDSFPSQLESAYVATRYCGSTRDLAKIQGAAEKQHHLAEAYLSMLYMVGCRALAKNTEQAQIYASRALPWLRMEAVRGNQHAQYHLGSCYIDGRGIEKDEEEAVRLLTLSADQGQAVAQCMLGKWVYHVQRCREGFPQVLLH
jgi:hypothetical protein